MTKFPKYLTNHPAVAFVSTGEDQGSSDDEYKWYVELKEDWCFSAGRNEGAGSLFLNTAENFAYANPMKRTAYDELRSNQDAY